MSFYTLNLLWFLSHFLSLATFESIIRIIQTPNVKKQQNLLSSRTFRTSQDLGVYLKMDFPIFFRLYAVFFYWSVQEKLQGIICDIYDI